MALRTIDEFVSRLLRIPEREFSRPRVLEELGVVPLDPASLRPYMFFSATHYTRNLIHRDDLFEVVALGWETGQQSMIHNHRDQECWMGVAAGRLEIQNYRLVSSDPAAGTCLLAPAARFLLDREHPAAVDPHEPIHAVLNPASFGERALSVHVYSRPFDSCTVYQLEAGRCFEVPLEYTSRHGKLCPGERAAVPVG